MTEPHEVPIDGVLDLHTFRPRDVKALIPAYIEACLERQIYNLRIIHGKGTGTLREVVRSTLAKHPAVAWFGSETATGSWGVTLVNLHRPVRSL